MIGYQLRQREYLLQISRAMTSRLDLPSLLRLILTSAADLVRAEAGVIALRRGRSTSLVIHASYGVPVSLLPRFAPLLTDFPLKPEDYRVPDLEARLNMVARADPPAAEPGHRTAADRPRRALRRDLPVPQRQHRVSRRTTRPCCPALPTRRPSPCGTRSCTSRSARRSGSWTR